MKKINKWFNLSLKRKKNLYGFLFIMPYIIGFLLFFLYPFIQSIQFSISDLLITPDGYKLDTIGLENYHTALFVNANYVRSLVNVFKLMVLEVPVIIMFSFFAAILINQKFRGRLAARLIFFIPVILGSGIVLQIERWDMMHILLESGGDFLETAETGGMFGPGVANFLLDLKIPGTIVTYIVNAVERIPTIIRSSGVQIIIFLAGLQSIPPSLYEASKMEGASGWENFWMITFPMLTPLILTNTVYTIIDSFTHIDNEVVIRIQDGAFSDLGFGLSSAMSIIYFTSIIIFLFVIVKLMSRGVFYQE